MNQIPDKYGIGTKQIQLKRPLSGHNIQNAGGSHHSKE